jgi:ubiquinol-cytochrome c reductase cytochrome b subunit
MSTGDQGVLQGAVTATERRTGRVSLIHHLMRYVFPDHWSFMWGEIALYCFVVLVVTGTYLALFFDPSYHVVVYNGSYAPLRGEKMSAAYASALHLSLGVKLGLLMRQTHHWAADLFIASITVHLMRVFFTGAFRRPREWIYWTGLTLLIVGVLEGYLGYSLVDDLLSGMGLAIGWGVGMSIPVIGGPLMTLLFNGPFPGTTVFESRLFIAHVFIIPLLIAALIGVHLLLITLLHHTQFAGRGAREGNVVGSPMWPSYAARSLGLFAVVIGVLFLLGAVVQINPIWLWGPYHPYLAENGAQPDWYLGWLIGALRMMPNWEPVIAGKTIVPNPFWGGVLFPLIVFGLLYAWPILDRRITHDYRGHHILQRPRDCPRRTAAGVALFTFTAVPFFAGAMDRVYLSFGIPYQGALQVMRVAWIVLPVVAAVLTVRVCRSLQRSELHPLRGVTARVVTREAGGGFSAGAAVLANPDWTPAVPDPLEPQEGVVAQVQAAAKRGAAGAGLTGTGAVLLVVAVAAVAVVVAAVASIWIPAWASALVAAAVAAVAAVALVALGRRAFRR